MADNSEKNAGDGVTAVGRCPLCGKPTLQPFRPFCSRRCADVDLSRWLTGAYAIASSTDDDDEDGEGPASIVPRRSAEEPE